MAKTVCKILGVIFLLVGVCGFAAPNLLGAHLSTPHNDLPFYLLTSAARTMTTASVSLLVAVFFLLVDLEVNAPDSTLVVI